MSVTIKIDTGMWDRLKAMIRGLEHKQVATGIFDDGELAEIGAHHEYGTVTIPERSWLRSTFRDEHDAMATHLAKLVRRFLDGRLTLDQMLGLFGLFTSNAVKRKITSGAGISPPLKPATIAAKKSSRPLVDTSRMLNAITWKIVA